MSVSSPLNDFVFRNRHRIKNDAGPNKEIILLLSFVILNRLIQGQGQEKGKEEENWKRERDEE